MNTHPLSAAACALFVFVFSEPSPGQDFNQALDVTGYGFSQDGPGWRQGGGAVSHDGTDCVVCETVPGNPSVLTTTIEGPGRLAFWWKLNGGGDADRFQFLPASEAGLQATWLSGALPSLQGLTKWRREELRLPPGPVRISWRVTSGGLPVAGLVPGTFLDELTWTPEGESIPVPQALDNAALTYRTAGGGQVRGLRDAADGNTYAVLTGQPADGGMPELRVPVPAGYVQVRCTSADVRGTTATWVKNTDTAGSGYLETLLYFPTAGDLTIQDHSVPFTVVIDSILTGLTADDALDAAAGVWQISGYYWPRRDAAALNGRYLQLEPAPFGSGAVDASVERTVTGTVRLALKTRGSPVIWWNGSPAWAANRLKAWTPVEWTSPPGGGTIRLSGAADVDALTLETLPDVTPAEAADSAPGFVWTTGPGWHGAPDRGSHDGADSIRSTPSAGSGTARVDWSGRGTVSWRAKEGLSSRTGSDYTSVVATRLDGAGIAQSLPFQRWRKFQSQTGAGPHWAEWSFNASTSAVPVFSAAVDTVGWQPDALVYSTAADSSAEQWWSEGDDTWAAATADAQSGGSALASPALEAGGDSSVSLRVTGPAVVKFWWRGRAAEFWTGTGPGGCRLSGPTNWREETFNIPGTGPAALTWKILADFSPVPAGALLVDNVRVLPPVMTGFDPVVPATAAAMTDGSLEFNATSGVALETVTGAETQDGVSSVRMPAGSTLRTEITAPAEIRFWWKASRPNVFDATPQAGGFLVLDGGPVAGWKQAVVVLGGSGVRAFEWRANAAVVLDGITAGAAQAPGTFSAGAGAMERLDWGVANIGTDALAADTVVPFSGSPSARFGADMSGLAWRSIDGTARRIVWQRRHDEPHFGGRLGGPAGVWQAGDFILPAASGNVSFITAQTGGHRWLAGLAEAAAPATAGEMLWSPEWTWTVSSDTHWKATAPGMLQSTQQGAWLSTEVQGPGWFLAQSVAGRLLVDAAQYLSPGTVILPLAAGTHTVRLEQNSSTAAAMTIPRFAREVPVRDALDDSTRPGLTIDSVPPAWVGIADRIYAADGVDAALSPVLTSTKSTIACSVTGPGWFRCRPLVFTPGTFVALKPEEGSPPLAPPPPANVWTYVSPGTWPVFVEAFGTAATGARRALVDLMDWRPETPVPLSPEAAAAMETSGLTWTTSSSLPFAPLADSAAANGSVAASPLIKTGESAWLQTTLPGPGTLFYYARNLQSTVPPALNFDTDGFGGITSAYEGARRTNTPDPVTLRIWFRHGTGSEYGEGTAVRLVFDRMVWVPDSDPGLPLASAFPGSGLTFGVPAGTARPWRALDLPGWGRCLVAADPSGNTAELPLSVSGPGTLSGDWWTYSVDGSGLYDAAGTAWLNPFLDGWWPINKFLVPQRNSPVLKARSVMLVRNPVFTPAPPLSLEEALDTPGRTWTTGGAAPWIGARRSEPEDDEVLSGILPAGQSTWLETTVTPPVTVKWTGYVSSLEADTLTLSAGGSILQTTPGSGGATRDTFTNRITGNTPVSLRWTYTRTASAAASISERTVSISSVTITPDGPPVSLEQATDASGLTLTAGSNAGVSWLAEGGVAFTGNQFLRLAGPPSPPAPANAEAWVETVLTGPGVFSAAIGGEVRILVNGAEINPRTLPASTVTWQPVWVPLTGAGPHTVRLASSKWNLARIDALRFEPLQPVSAAGLPGATFSGDAGWIVFGPPESRSMASLTEPGTPRLLQADITGPVIFQSAVSGGTWNFTVNDTRFTAGGVLWLPAGTHRLRWKTDASVTISGLSISPRNGSIADVPRLLGAPELIMRTFNLSSYPAATATPFFAGQPYLQIPNGHPPAVLQPGAGRMRWAQRSASTAGKWNMLASATSFTPKEMELQVPGAETVALAALEFVPVPGLTTGSALDDDGCITWTTIRGWYPAADPALSYDGADALIAAPPAVGSAVLEGSVSGPATITFSRSANVHFFVNGTRLVEATSGTQPVEYRVELAAGPHLLRWERPEDASSSFGTGILDRFLCISGANAAAPVMAAVSSKTSSAPFTPMVSLVTTPCLRDRVDFYPPSVIPVAARPGNFIAMEPRPLNEVIGVPGVVAGGWQGFGVSGSPGGIAWLPPAGGASRTLAFDVTGNGVLTMPASLTVSGSPVPSSFKLTANNNSYSAPAGTGIPLTGAPAWHVTMSATQEVAVSGLSWTGYLPEQDFATFAQAAGLNGDGALPEADPDHDGRSSFAEFAFGGNPAAADTPPAAPLPVIAAWAGAPHPAVDFTGTTHGVIYSLEIQTENGWQQAASSLEVLTETAPLRRARLILTSPSLPASGPVILRVIATGWPR